MGNNKNTKLKECLVAVSDRESTRLYCSHPLICIHEKGGNKFDLNLSPEIENELMELNQIFHILANIFHNDEHEINQVTISNQKDKNFVKLLDLRIFGEDRGSLDQFFLDYDDFEEECYQIIIVEDNKGQENFVFPSEWTQSIFPSISGLMSHFFQLFEFISDLNIVPKRVSGYIFSEMETQTIFTIEIRAK